MLAKLFLIAILAIVVGIIPASAFGQVAQLPNTTISTQCIDLNQDRICEAVVLANGTMINFTKPNPTPEKKIVLPPWCEGLTLSRCPPPDTTQTQTEQTTLIDNCTMPDPKTQCLTKVLDNGTLLVTNGTPKPVIPTTTGERIDFSNVPITETPFGETDDEFVIEEEDEVPATSGGSSDNDDGGDDGDDKPNPYCDLVPDNYKGSCHDRYDYDQVKEERGEKDIYLCNDGKYKSDPLNCDDVSGYDYDNGNDEEDNDKDNDGTDDDEPRELEEGEEIHVGEAVEGYEEDDGELEEDE